MCWRLLVKECIPNIGLQWHNLKKYIYFLSSSLSKIIKMHSFGSHFRVFCRLLVKECIPNIDLRLDNFRKKFLFLVFLNFYKIFFPPPPSSFFLILKKNIYIYPIIHCIDATIRIGREIQCLPYAKFFWLDWGGLVDHKEALNGSCDLMANQRPLTNSMERGHIYEYCNSMTDPAHWKKNRHCN